MVRSTLTYVYCLVRSTRRPSLRNVPAAVPGGQPVRLLDVPDVFDVGRRRSGVRLRPERAGPDARRRTPALGHWLVVSSVPAAMYGEAALLRGLQRLEWVGPRALAHEVVVEHFLSASAVLPMQLFALFRGDDRAVAHIAGDRRRIARILSRIEGHVEWGLRVTWNPATRARNERARATRGPRRAGRMGLSGADYLARKRDLLEAGRVRLQRARADAHRVYRVVSRQATASRRRTEVEQATPGSRVLLDAAFLVPVRRRRAFQAAVRRHARPLARAGLAVSLTGPWPAYNFI